MAIYGGEIFGNNAPSPYHIARDAMQFDAQNKRIAQAERRAQQANDAKVGNAIRSTFDKNHLTTGTSADPVINGRLQDLILKYSNMYKESKGSLDATDMYTAMQGDMVQLKGYYDSVNTIKANAQKSAKALAKEYPGFNEHQLYQKAMDRALYKDGQVIQNVEDFDLNADYVNDVVDNDYASLNIGPKGMYSELQKLPLSTVDRDIITRDKAGLDVRHRGRATYNQDYQDISYDPVTGEPKVGLKTITVTRPDGTEYIDKSTGQPVKTIDETAYQSVTQNRQLNARVNQVADQRIAEMKAKGVAVDDADRNILRRQVATDEIDGVFKNRTNFISSTKNPLPKGHGRKIGRATEMLPFDIDSAPSDSYGNRNLTGQVGNFTVYDATNRGGNAPAEVWITPKGGLLIKKHHLNEFGNRTGKVTENVYYGDQAQKFIQANGGWSGNNKKDLFKMLDLFDGSVDDTKADAYATGQERVVTNATPKPKEPAKPAQTKSSNKKKLSY